jgi:vitamin B12 transporter
MSLHPDPIRLRIAAGLAGLACALSARAQETSPPTPLEPVVVTPTRIATPLTQIGSAVTLITDADIARNQWRTLPDALADVPGLNVVQTGGPGGQTSVFIRGANANHTKVIVDGIDVDDPSIGAFDFGQVLTDDIARIEVLRGPVSSLYGSDALGGVINIVTRTGEGPPSLAASLEGGSFDTFNQTLAVRGSTAKISYAFDAAHVRSADTPVTPIGLLAPGEADPGNRYDNLTLSTRLGADLSDRLGLDLVARYTDAWLSSTGENFDVSPAVPDAALTVQHEQQVFTRLQTRFSQFDGALKSVLGVGYTDYQTRIQAPDDDYGLPPATTDFGNRFKVDYQGTIDLGPDRSLVIGAEHAIDRIVGSPIDAHDAYSAGYGELQGRVAGDLFGAVSVRYDGDDRFGGKPTWRIAPTYTIAATGTQLKASYGTGFKAPTLNQLFVSFPQYDFFANPDLKPEQSRGFDVGFEQPVAGDRARFGATYFHNSISDLIDTNALGTPYINIAKATTYGVESFVMVSVNRAVRLRSDYTYTIATDDATGLDLLRRPKQKVDVSASWQATRRLALTASGLYVGSWIDGNRDFSIPRLRASPYFVANLAASYDIGHGVELFGRVDNLLDRHYQDPVGFQRPGLGAFVGARVKIGG